MSEELWSDRPRWAPKGFGRFSRTSVTAMTLKSAVGQLSPKAKQAFHAAATYREIRRGTWTGCAFNAGGEHLGDNNINNVYAAAELFEMPVKDVSNFIRLWDKSNYSSDKHATAILKDLIEEVGLFSSPKGQEYTFAGKTFVQVIHESDTSREKRIFDTMVEGLNFDPDVTHEDETVQNFKEAVTEASVLLQSQFA